MEERPEGEIDVSRGDAVRWSEANRANVVSPSAQDCAHCHTLPYQLHPFTTVGRRTGGDRDRWLRQVVEAVCTVLPRERGPKQRAEIAAGGEMELAYNGELTSMCCGLLMKRWNKES